MGVVVQFPVTLDALIRQLEIADAESRRLKAEAERLERELLQLREDVIKEFTVLSQEELDWLEAFSRR